MCAASVNVRAQLQVQAMLPFWSGCSTAMQDEPAVITAPPCHCHAGDNPAKLEFDWGHWSAEEEGEEEEKEGPAAGAAPQQRQPRQGGAGGSGWHASAGGGSSGSTCDNAGIQGAGSNRCSSGVRGSSGGNSGGAAIGGSSGGSAGGGGGGRPAAGGRVCRPEMGYYPESAAPTAGLVLLNLSGGEWRPSQAAVFRLFKQYGYIVGGALSSSLAALLPCPGLAWVVQPGCSTRISAFGKRRARQGLAFGGAPPGLLLSACEHTPAHIRAFPLHSSGHATQQELRIHQVPNRGRSAACAACAGRPSAARPDRYADPKGVYVWSCLRVSLAPPTVMDACQGEGTPALASRLPGIRLPLRCAQHLVERTPCCASWLMTRLHPRLPVLSAAHRPPVCTAPLPAAASKVGGSVCAWSALRPNSWACLGFNVPLFVCHQRHMRCLRLPRAEQLYLYLLWCSMQGSF